MQSMSLTYAQITTELSIDESTACESATRGAALIPTEGMIDVKKCEVAQTFRRCCTESLVSGVIGFSDTTGHWPKGPLGLA